MAKLAWVDVLRILASLGVVTIHVSAMVFHAAGEVSEPTWWCANVLNAATRCAVPLFVMISGALLLGRSEGLRACYSRRLSRLGIAVGFWSLLYTGVGILKGLSPASRLGLLLLGYPWFHMWYLFMYAGLILVTPYINMLLAGRRPTQGELALLVGILMGLMVGQWAATFATTALGWGRGAAWAMFPAFLGYYLAGYVLSRTTRWHSRAGRIVLLATAIAALVIAAVGNSLVRHRLGLLSDSLASGPYSPWAAVITVCLFVWVRSLCGSTANVRWLRVPADSALGVYLVHPLWLLLLPRVVAVRHFTVGMVPAAVLCIYGLSLITAAVLGRIPGVRRTIGL